MKKYIYYLFLIINIGFLFYLAYNNVQLDPLVDNQTSLFYKTIFTAVTYVIPQSLGLPFVYLANIITFNLLLVIIYVIFILPFVFIFGGGAKW